MSNDWLALFSALGVPIVWVMHLAFPYLRSGGTSPLALAAALSALALAVLAWRIARVKALFVSGRRVNGIVTGLNIVKDRGRLEYEFPVQGAIVKSWCPVHKTKQVRALSVGDGVEILYDGRDPRKSIVKDLFAA